LIILFSTLSLYITLNFIKSRKTYLLPLLLLSNSCFALFQFLTILIIGAQCALVLLAFLLNKFKIKFTHLVAFSLCAFIPYIPNITFLLGKFSSGVNGNRLNVAREYILNVLRTLSPDLWVVTVVAICVISIIAILKFKIEKNVYTLFLAVYVFVPIIPLVIVGYNSYFNPWHLSFVIPALLIIFSDSIEFLCSRVCWLSYACVVLYGLIFAGIMKSGNFYSIDSNTGQYKQFSLINKNIGLDIGTLLPTDFETLKGISWYNRHSIGNDPWNDSAKREYGRGALLNFLTFREFAHYAKDKLEFEQKYVKNSTSKNVPGGVLYIKKVAYDPLVMQSFPYEAKISADPLSFFSHIQNYKNITILPFFGFKVIPLLDSEEGHFEYEFTLDPSQNDMLYKVYFKYLKLSPDDKISFAYHFDDSKYSELQDTKVTDGNGGSCTLLLKTSSPHRKLLIRCVMERKSKIPGYMGYDNTVLGLESLHVYANDLKHENFTSQTLNITSQGIGEIENDIIGKYVWAYGPNSTLTFTAPNDTVVTLDYAFNNPIPDQDVTIYCNGNEIQKYKKIPAQAWLRQFIYGSLVVPVHKGINTIEFDYRAWNQCPHDQNALFAANDKRHMALAFTKLLINTQLAHENDLTCQF